MSHFLGSDQTRTWLAQTITTTLGPEWYDEYYGSQVTYLNTLLLDVVRRILAQSSCPPIIVIQGDHGPGSIRNWDAPARDELLERLAIFDAVYLPQSGVRLRPSAELYDSISPVNTFRIILSRYFDTTMALLPDRSYFSSGSRPYRLCDVARPEFYPVRGAHGMDK